MSTSPDVAPAAALKVDPESVALRALPRPVTRLNRRMLAVGVGALAAVVLGGTIWSLQSNKRQHNPATELYNVDRISRAENLDQLPKDYAGIPPAVKQAPPVLGEPLPGDLGPAIVKAQHLMETRPPGGGVDPAQAERLAAEEAARSSVFFRNGAGTGGPKSAGAQNAIGFRQSAVQSHGDHGSGSSALRSHECAEPAGSEGGVHSEGRRHDNAQSRRLATARVAVPGDGGHDHPGGAGDWHQF
jgi:type IV secretory pathway VirB10-like protein